MAAISDYLESQLLNHLFRSDLFPKPSSIAIALTNGVVKDSDTGSTLPEVPTGNQVGAPTGYGRIVLGDPASSGDYYWSEVGEDTVTTFSVYLDAGDSVRISNPDTTFDISVTSLSGYFYPLYTSETISDSLSTTTPRQSYRVEFLDKFPGIALYSPLNTFQSGIPTNPGYTSYEGNGFIKNNVNLSFNEADSDWGTISGIAILDSATYGEGNILMHSQLTVPRVIRQSDSVRFNTRSLEINIQ